MLRKIILFLGLSSAALAQSITWGGSGSTAPGGTQYSVVASGNGVDSANPTVTMLKEGNFAASGAYAAQYNSTDNVSASPVHYSASAYAPGNVPLNGSYAVTIVTSSMTPPTSANASATYGTSFFPAITTSASNGTGALLWCPAGYLNWTPSAWVPPGVGNYTFYVAQKADVNHTGNNNDPLQGDIEVNGSPYTLTITKAQMSPPSLTAGSYSIPVHQSWSGPGVSLPANNGTGAAIWCVAGATNWINTAWTPGVAGNYTLYCGQKGDANHLGGTNDANQGDIVVGNSAPITITAHLTVSSGSGSGDYAVGTVVNISANAPPANSQFSGWSVSGPGTIGNSGASSTTYTVGNDNVTVTANYSTINYVLTVQNGSGGGTYASGSSVAISANAAAAGYQFSSWSLSGSGTFQNSGASSTNFTITGTSTVTANYSTIPYSLTVNNGTGGGTYSIGNSVTITATPPSGYHFTSWSQNSGPGSIGNTASSSTTFTMGAGSAAVTANYAQNTSAPAFSQQPSSQTVGAGSNVTFTSSASGTPTPTYQWYFNSSAISGATGASLTLSNVQPGNAGSYYVVASNSAGSATSNTVSLTVISPPVITSPTSANGTTGTAFSYQITASNSPTSFGATGLPSWLSLNTSTGAITGTPTTAGTFTCSITASNAGGTSSAVTLTITVSTATQPDTTNQNQLNIHLPN